MPIQYWGSGAAERFLAFLSQELRPYLHKQYRLDPEDAVLVGDSVGGLFALYTVFHQPEAFQRYVIGSPSIYHDDAITFAYEATYAKAHQDLPVTIFLSGGT